MSLRQFMFGLFLFMFVSLSSGIGTAADNKSVYNSWKTVVGGEERFRAEYRSNFDLKDTAKDNASWFYNRLKVGARASYSDEYLNDRFVVFMEGLDARSSNDRQRVKNDGSQRDNLDLHQAFVQAINVADSGIDLKFGRQEFKYGAGRLVAAPTWSNRVRALDGGLLRYSGHGLSVDVFSGSDVKYDTEKFNTPRWEETLSGAYFSYQKNGASPLFDWYYLNFRDVKGATDSHRQTVGARIRTLVAAQTILDIELPYQFGRQTGKDIHAYAFHVDLSRTLSSVIWKPKFFMAYDLASGDKNSSDNKDTTFVPLYQSTHDPYGLLDIVRWQNIRCAETGVTFYPTSRWSFTPQADFIWLDSRHGAWYSSSGTVTRAATAADVSSYLGTEISIRSSYELTKNVKLEGGYAHLYAGDYLRDTAGGDDSINWFYAQTIIKF